MPSRLGGLSLATAGLAALGALAAACGSGGEALTLEEYFQRVDEIGGEAEAGFEEGAAEPPAEDASEEEVATFAQDSIRQSATVLQEARDSLDELDPPSEVEGPHGQFISALGKEAEAIQAVADGLPDALSTSDLEALDAEFDTPELNEAYEQQNKACLALQAVADKNEIDVDLECG
jgi:hypothetical protein